MVASRPEGAVKGLGANHELAAEPPDVVLLVHDGQACEVVPLIGLAVRSRHVHGNEDGGQRGAVQPHKGPLICPAVCICNIQLGFGTVSDSSCLASAACNPQGCLKDAYYAQGP